MKIGYNNISFPFEFQVFFAFPIYMVALLILPHLHFVPFSSIPLKAKTSIFQLEVCYVGSGSVY